MAIISDELLQIAEDLDSILQACNLELNEKGTQRVGTLAQLAHGIHQIRLMNLNQRFIVPERLEVNTFGTTSYLEVYIGEEEE